MDLIDKLKSIGERIPKLKDQVETEEATKNAFVMPFISALGYDVFSPLEVKPEFVADIGIKKGEKVDYCILVEDVPRIIVECKHWKEVLDPHNSQLFRYFHVTPAKFGILTNGIYYRFYTDLETPNKMDEKPFLEFSLETITEQVVNELKRFIKGNFDVDEIYSNAGDLKYSKEIKEILSREMSEPSKEFIKFFASRVYQGKVTAKILEQFEILVKKSVKSLISEMISGRLQSALEREQKEGIEAIEITEQSKNPEKNTDGNETDTTEEEWEGFRIVRAILRQVVTPDRVVMRDVKSYCGILLDNNNRQPIVRLHFNRSQKYIGVFDSGSDSNEEDKIPIESLDDIYTHSERIINSVSNYLRG